MATQTFTTPMAAAQGVRTCGAARPSALKTVRMASLKPASIFGSAVNCKATKASRIGSSRVVVVRAADDKVVVIGLAADSGCGKSTFMRRVTGIFGGTPKPPSGGNPDSNTLISEMTTVICLDDYHSLDRNGRKVEKVTALDPKAQNFELMYQQVRRRPPICPPDAHQMRARRRRLPDAAPRAASNCARCCLRQACAAWLKAMAHAAGVQAAYSATGTQLQNRWRSP